MRTYLRLILKQIFDKIFEKQSEDAEWIKLVEDIVSNTEGSKKPPEFIQSKNFFNNCVIISFLRNTLHYAVSCTAQDMAKS